MPSAPRRSITSLSVAAALVLLAAGCQDSTGTNTSLVGRWDWIGFTDDFGNPYPTTGYWEFRANATFTVNGSYTPPGGAPGVLNFDGTYVQTGNSVAVTYSGTDTWTLIWGGNQVTLTSVAQQNNTITLRRQ